MRLGKISEDLQDYLRAVHYYEVARTRLEV